MSICMQPFTFTDLFLEMQCDRNDDGTKNLILRGNDLFKKIGERINDGHFVAVTTFLRKHPEVIALEFPYNEISDCGMSTLADFLRERPTIRHVNLMGNRIGPRGVKHLVDLDESLPLYSLRLSGNKFGNEGAKELSKLFYKKVPLKCLDLSDTHQTATGLAYLITGLMKCRGGTESIEYIDLGRPLPQAHHAIPDSHLAEQISLLLATNQSLKEIHIQQYCFDFRDAEILVNGLLVNKTLICLDLNNNSIGDDGVEYLCRYLKTSPRLECLMIGANSFGNSGATALSFSLPYTKIKLLDITNNRITDEGMINVFYTIRKKVKLKAFFIWGNKITRKSLVALQRLFHGKVLEPENVDVKLFCSDNELKAAWNPRANRYQHRFYCVSDYGHPPLRQIVKYPPPPVEPPPINYRFHVDSADVGLPVIDWQKELVQSKFIDPL